MPGRELGDGGMSRVLVAHDEALARDVVVKVLAPELALGLSSERFVREIQLAAPQRVPHIALRDTPAFARCTRAPGVSAAQRQRRSIAPAPGAR